MAETAKEKICDAGNAVKETAKSGYDKVSHRPQPVRPPVQNNPCLGRQRFIRR